MRMLLLKTWRDMLARKGQFAALVLLVTLGISIYAGFFESYRNLKASGERAYSELRFEDFSVSVLSAPASVTDRVRALPGVAAAEGRLVVDVGLDVAPGEQGTVRIVTLPDRGVPSVDALVVQGGTMPAPGQAPLGALHSQFAEEVGVYPGDTLGVRVGDTVRRVRIVGIAGSPEYIFPVRAKGELPSLRGFTIVWMRTAAAETLLDRHGEVTSIVVRVKPGADAQRVMDAVEEELEPYGVVATTLAKDQPSNAYFASELEQNRVMTESMPPVILVIAALSLAIALSRLVESQRGEIGLAKALGYSDGQILGHYLLFSVCVALLGTVLGLALGHLIGSWMTDLYVEMLRVPYLASHLYYDIWVTAFEMSFASCLIAGIVPAWRSARMTPARAMHPDPNLSLRGGGVPLLERIFAPVLPRALIWRMPLRNVFRAKRRSLYTVIGLALALVLTVGTAAFWDSTQYVLDTYFVKVELWDMAVFYEQPRDLQFSHTIAGVAGVKRVQTALVFPATISANGGTHEAAVTGIRPGADFHGFSVAQGDPVEESLRNGGLILPDIIAERLGVGVGDTVDIKTPYRDEQSTIAVTSITDEAVSAPIYTGFDRAVEVMGLSRPMFNAAYLSTDGRWDSRIREDLFDMAGTTQVMVQRELQEMFASMMEFSYVMYGTLLAFGFMMAAVVIYTTFSANVHERTREIATMRTIGEDAGHLSAIVTIENLMLAVVGIPVGVWAGFRLAQWIMDSMFTSDFSLHLVLLPTTLASVVAAVLVVLLLSEVPPIRKIFRLDLAEATKVIE
jgi:putative ABC transport system permease protein